ncbi:MAG: YceI family protein [Candidatus Obscuribacterales bacterium]|nr:YceI family protein [Candidatus Obscuribacterales bacterium]
MFKALFASTASLALIFSASAAIAAPRAFTINDDKNRDLASFDSDAPLELIHGRTPKITGSISIDDSLDLTKPLAANFDVDLASIDTGIDLRNEHMRDNFLETAKYPKASFVLKKFLNPPKKLEAGKKITLKAQGDFSLHGKTVSKTIPVDLVYMTKCPSTESKRPGCDIIQIKAVFAVPFKDHNIKRPEAVFQKLADQVIVTVSATAYNQVGDAASKDKTSKAPAGKTK